MITWHIRNRQYNYKNISGMQKFTDIIILTNFHLALITLMVSSLMLNFIRRFDIYISAHLIRKIS